MSIKARAFAQVDVFSSHPYRGNPVAVVLEAEDLPEADMQQLASWTNLSETTFVLPPTAPEADYRLRIFTPGGELPFAGHPTLGSAHAWLESGHKPKHEQEIIQECAAGLVKIRRNVIDETLSFEAPPTIRSGPLEESLVIEFCQALNISRDRVIAHQWVDNGPGFAALQLATAAEVLAVDPNLAMISNSMLGLVGAHPVGGEHDFELRAFCPRIGVVEDPVTGSLNASVAQWFFRDGIANGSYRAAQGTRLGRAGTVLLSESAEGSVWVGGRAQTLIRGEIVV